MNNQAHDENEQIRQEIEKQKAAVNTDRASELKAHAVMFATLAASKGWVYNQFVDKWHAEFGSKMITSEQLYDNLFNPTKP